MDEQNKILFKNAIINQIETDIDAGEFGSIDVLLDDLLKRDDNVELLLAFLSDSAKENWQEGRTTVRF